MIIILYMTHTFSILKKLIIVDFRNQTVDYRCIMLITFASTFYKKKKSDIHNYVIQ